MIAGVWLPPLSDEAAPPEAAGSSTDRASKTPSPGAASPATPDRPAAAGRARGLNPQSPPFSSPPHHSRAPSFAEVLSASSAAPSAPSPAGSSLDELRVCAETLSLFTVDTHCDVLEKNRLESIYLHQVLCLRRGPTYTET